jgi:hypothetical protein
VRSPVAIPLTLACVLIYMPRQTEHWIRLHLPPVIQWYTSSLARAYLLRLTRCLHTACQGESHKTEHVLFSRRNAVRITLFLLHTDINILFFNSFPSSSRMSSYMSSVSLFFLITVGQIDRSRVLLGRAMAQAVSRWLPTAAVRV